MTIGIAAGTGAAAPTELWRTFPLDPQRAVPHRGAPPPPAAPVAPRRPGSAPALTVAVPRPDRPSAIALPTPAVRADADNALRMPALIAMALLLSVAGVGARLATIPEWRQQGLVLERSRVPTVALRHRPVLLAATGVCALLALAALAVALL